MKIVLLSTFKIILKVIYFFIKLLPTNNKKITFISRQSDTINIDFSMISKRLIKEKKDVKIVFLCKKIKPGILSKIDYGIEILKQMVAIATSKIVIIDSYCIPVCILKHKKGLFVLQIWHSIGKIKKSGYQSLDTKGGRTSFMAKAMCMHKNYDRIIAGGEAFDEFYELGFNVKKDKLLHYGLPRIDYLIENENKLKERIYNKYPEFKNKKVVYYVPTFRKYDPSGFKDLIKKYNKKDFILIVRGHPNQKLKFDRNIVYECLEFKSQDLLAIADYVITDYSSICLEAAILNKKVLFYTYDHTKYLTENGINLDAEKVLPNCTSRNIDELYDIIKKDNYDNSSYQNFRKKYLPKKLGNSTKLITDYVIKRLEKR